MVRVRVKTEQVDFVMGDGAVKDLLHVICIITSLGPTLALGDLLSPLILVIIIHGVRVSMLSAIGRRGRMVDIELVLIWFVVVLAWFVVIRTWFVVILAWFVVIRTWFVVILAWFVVILAWFVVIRTWFVVIITW